MVRVGLTWLKDNGEVLVVLAVAVMMPQELMSEEQTVIEAVPEVWLVVKVTTEPLMLLWIVAEFELFKMV